MKNLKIYNNCREDVISGMQFKNKHTEYNIGKTLFAVSDVGLHRYYQEDSVIIMEHPNDRDFKLIAVADGLGGHGDGDLASNHIIRKIMQWFEHKKIIDEKNVSTLKEELELLISNSIYDLNANPYAATTLSLAIIGKDKTLIANVGDSRIYTYASGTLEQETIDDSEVQELYEKKRIPSKELMRFHHKNNVLTQAISKRLPRFKTNFTVIDNSYDSIIAVSDGVSDCVSYEELNNIVKNSQSTEVAKNIVQKALNNDSYLIDAIKKLPETEKEEVLKIKEIIKKDYSIKIPKGKDNATAAVYIRKYE